jgi:hypothetical protein
MCVQDVDVQCVLQFTLLHAAGCALHRHTSRVIHRLELYLEFAIFRSPTSAYNYVHALSVQRPYIERRKKRRHTGATSERQLVLRTVASVRHVGSPNAAHPFVRKRRQTPGQVPRRAHNRVIFDTRTAIGFSGRPRPPLSVQRFASYSSRVAKTIDTDERISVMILPQVHLRKPCYDFYFL